MISMLTEPKWFKGSLDDMMAAREVVQSMDQRPAILRKDFIVDVYQLLEARACGADCVLLIVALLTQEQLDELIDVRERHRIGVYDESKMIANTVAMTYRQLTNLACALWSR